MKKILSLSLVALILIAILDYIWIGFVASNFYRVEMGVYYSSHPVWYAAVLFYIIYILGLVYFVIAPAVREHSCLKAALAGAFFALVAFGTYDLTALSVITNWPPILSFVDLAWGTVEGAIVSLGTYLIATKVFRW